MVIHIIQIAVDIWLYYHLFWDPDTKCRLKATVNFRTMATKRRKILINYINCIENRIPTVIDVNRCWVGNIKYTIISFRSPRPGPSQVSGDVPWSPVDSQGHVHCAMVREVPWSPVGSQEQVSRGGPMILVRGCCTVVGVWGGPMILSQGQVSGGGPMILSQGQVCGGGPMIPSLGQWDRCLGKSHDPLSEAGVQWSLVRGWLSGRDSMISSHWQVSGGGPMIPSQGRCLMKVPRSPVRSRALGRCLGEVPWSPAHSGVGV